MYVALVSSHLGYKFLSTWTEYVDITWVQCYIRNYEGAAFMGLCTLYIFLCQVIFTVSGPGLADVCQVIVIVSGPGLADVCQVIVIVSGPGLADVCPGTSFSEIGTLSQLSCGQPYK